VLCCACRIILTKIQAFKKLRRQTMPHEGLKEYKVTINELISGLKTSSGRFDWRFVSTPTRGGSLEQGQTPGADLSSRAACILSRARLRALRRFASRYRALHQWAAFRYSR
jgi:hypothetical protein